MNKYLTFYTILIIAISNAMVYAFSFGCSSLFESMTDSLPLLTKLSWVIIQNNIFLWFSLLTTSVIPVLHLTSHRNNVNSYALIILGLHLLIMSTLLFSFSLPFVSMCEVID